MVGIGNLVIGYNRMTTEGFVAPLAVSPAGPSPGLLFTDLAWTTAQRTGRKGREEEVARCQAPCLEFARMGWKAWELNFVRQDSRESPHLSIEGSPDPPLSRFTSLWIS